MKSFESKAWVLPQPVLIIGTYDSEGKANAMNAAWGGQWDNHQIMISMGSHKTTENLNLCGDFTVGVATLIRGMKAEDAIARLEGIKCGGKPTSCPDQMARALRLL